MQSFLITFLVSQPHTIVFLVGLVGAVTPVLAGETQGMFLCGTKIIVHRIHYNHQYGVNMFNRTVWIINEEQDKGFTEGVVYVGRALFVHQMNTCHFITM
jgi:hypothetical protein